MDDIVIPGAKKALIKEANSKVDEIQRQYLQGHITNEERYNRVIEVWSSTNELITNELMDELKKDHDGFNPVYMMAHSGARGSRSQIRQLAGMRGLMAKPSGDIIELPIRSNFKEGLSVIEFFISTNGARKGLADTALKTADAGYLTRRLVDIAQDVVISEEDCGTINGIEQQGHQGRRGHRRAPARPDLGPLLPGEGEAPDHRRADRRREPGDRPTRSPQAIEEAGIEGVRIRSVLTCDSKYGVCGRCYGRNLATYKPIEIGEAVGIIAAQSIGQPGTQLTMRTFHIGGAATKISEENRIFLKYPVFVEKIQGSMVKIDNGNMLFTRKGIDHRAPHPAELRAAEGRQGAGEGRPAAAQARARAGHPEEGRDDHLLGDLLREAPAQPAAAHRAAAGHRHQERRGGHRQGERRGPRRGDHRVLRSVQRAHHRGGRRAS